MVAVSFIENATAAAAVVPLLRSGTSADPTITTVGAPVWYRSTGCGDGRIQRVC